MSKIVKKPHQVQSVIKEHLSKKMSIAEAESEECFVISLKHLDRSQGPTVYEWENSQMLALAIETLAGYCKSPLHSQFSDKFTLYGDFPLKSEYTHPSHVPEDAKWARIHVNGKHILAGHVFKNTFYIVFFDAEHKFYLTKGANN